VVDPAGRGKRVRGHGDPRRRISADRTTGTRKAGADGGRSFGLPATLSRDRASLHAVTSPFRIDVPDTVLARARRGDVRAFEQVYRLFERPAWTLALRLCGDAEDAREVVHDAMLHLFQRIGQFRGESPFWGWVRRIVVNEALMRLRRERGKAFEDLDEGNEPVDDGSMPWACLDRGRLDAALTRLSEAARSVIWLYHVEGYTHAEIADMTGKSVSFSKSQLARGTARLRELLGAGEVDIPCTSPLAATA